MKHFLSKHRLFVRFVIFMIPLFLLFVGIRLPDFSRLQKPKPMRRAILENKNVQNFQEAIKKITLEPITINQATPKVTPQYRHVSQPRADQFVQRFLPAIPLPPRAPPVWMYMNQLG